MYVDKMLEVVTHEVYKNFKVAIEIGKWPDGNPLTKEQKEICMQAIIAYEAKFIPEEARTGYIPPKKTPCASSSSDNSSSDNNSNENKTDDTKPIKWSE